MTGLVTTITYPRGTSFTSGVISEGTLNASGTKWRNVDLLEGQEATIRLTVEIDDLSLFNTGTKEIRATTAKSPSEIVLVNNVIVKVIE